MSDLLSKIDCPGDLKKLPADQLPLLAREIRELSLDVPLPVELAEGLRENGIPVPRSIITTEEMVDYLCQLK